MHLRVGLGCWIGALAAWQSWVFWSVPRPGPSDFAQLWAAAGAWLHGANPYDIVGPGRAFEWPFPLYYPFPAVLVAMPFSVLPLRYADALFAAVGAAVLVFALTKHGVNAPPLAALVSTTFLSAIQSSQWSPLTTGAALLPSLGFLLAAKPTVGLALLIAYPSARALIGVAAFMAISVAIYPHWLFDWQRGLGTSGHIVPPVTHFGGPLILLSWLKWRRPEARLLGGLACVPQTLFHYEALPLFLIARTWLESLLLVALSVVAFTIHQRGMPYASYDAWVAESGKWVVLLLYLPCTVMVLRRPNVLQAQRPSRDDASAVPDEASRLT